MPISDPNQDREYPLDDSIEELETYIQETEQHGPLGQTPVLSEQVDRDHTQRDIPILDEVVGAEDYPAPPVNAAAPAVTEHQLLDLIDNLEHRLTGVLETLVKSMKDEMLDSISEEVKTQIDNYQQELDSRSKSARPAPTEPDYSHLDGYRPYGK